jgi:hypothetical protein
VLGGIIVLQAILYGPSLTGQKILLSVDLLAQPNYYLPRTPEVCRIVPHDVIMSDMILQGEPARQFALAELHAGRLPFWCPYEYAGVPSYRWNFSPICALNYLFASPVVLAWTQMLIALVTGVGAYLFCRRVLGVGYWPAAIAAWCLPISGTPVIWEGCGAPPVICWLPWMLWAVHSAIRQPLSWAGLAVALLTFVILISGAMDIAGQVLLTAGLFAVWCYFDHYGKTCIRPRSMLSLVGVGTGWLLGILMATPLLFPLLEYSGTGARMIRRQQGEEERPPVGLTALPQVVLPEMYGLTQPGSLRYVYGNRPESSAAAYAGLLATLLLAPLAWCSRRHRSINCLWTALGFLGLAWCINVPGLVTLMRMPGLNMMSYNRLVFVTTFAILAMAAVGLDVLWRGEVSRRWWFGLPMCLLAVLFGWCVYRSLVLPELIGAQLPAAISQGRVVGSIHDLGGVAEVQSNFSRSYAVAAALSAIGLLGWFWLWFRAKVPAWSVPVLGAILLGDLLWFGYGVACQSDPWLYYPPIPALQAIAKSTPGRVIGYACLPAKLALTQGLHDIRGYDAIDPLRLIQVLGLAAARETPLVPYALIQWLIPRVDLQKPGVLRLHPVLDMLGVRYVIFRGTPPPGILADFVSTDYWVLVNKTALPRVFIPNRVEVVGNDQQRLQHMGDEHFDPRDVAYVEQPLSTALPAGARGTVSIVNEIPMQITLSLDMQTAGLVVLADLWDTGWKAYLNGTSVPILRTNHAVRGVVAPAGQGKLEFRYEPNSFAWGIRIAGLALLVWIVWAGLVLFARKYALSQAGERRETPVDMVVK